MGTERFNPDVDGDKVRGRQDLSACRVLPSVACDVLALVSRPDTSTGDDEGFGMCLIEAGACGKPVIGGRTAAVVAAVVDGVTGVVFDATGMAAAIVRLPMPLGLAEAVGRERRRRAEERFGWAARIPQLELELESRFDPSATGA